MKVLNAEEARPLEGGASLSLSNRLYRVAWMAAWLVFGRFTEVVPVFRTGC